MSTFFPPRPKRESIRTAICREEAADHNPFIAGKTLWHGYDAARLAERHGWTEMLFLLAQGELPTPAQNELLNRLMASLANPGPRDAAVRAAMNCGVGKTPLPTIMTTGLTVRGGMAEGAMHVEIAMRLLQGQLLEEGYHEEVGEAEYAVRLIGNYRHFWRENSEEEVVALPEIPPGFGLYYGDRDPRAGQLIDLTDGEGGEYLQLALNIESVLAKEDEPQFLTLSGVVAALLCDLGFSPEHGAGVYLIAGSAGIFAHGVEQLPRNWNEYPFWADPSYYRYDGPDPSKRVENTP